MWASPHPWKKKKKKKRKSVQTKFKPHFLISSTATNMSIESDQWLDWLEVKPKWRQKNRRERGKKKKKRKPADSRQTLVDGVESKFLWPQLSRRVDKNSDKRPQSWCYH